MKIQNLPDAIEMLTQSTLRNVIAHMTLDETFSSRERISEQLRERTLHDAERHARELRIGLSLFVAYVFVTDGECRSCELRS
jgi:regulator of protease activity HflC (stomatin/prohibitin superfamily)